MWSFSEHIKGATKRTAVSRANTSSTTKYQVQLTCSYLFGLHRCHQLAENTRSISLWDTHWRNGPFVSQRNTYATETGICAACGVCCSWRSRAWGWSAIQLTRTWCRIHGPSLGFHGSRADPTHTHVMLCLHCCGAFSPARSQLEHERRHMRQLKADQEQLFSFHVCVWCCFVSTRYRLRESWFCIRLPFAEDAMCCSWAEKIPDTDHRDRSYIDFNQGCYVVSREVFVSYHKSTLSWFCQYAVRVCFSMIVLYTKYWQIFLPLSFSSCSACVPSVIFTKQCQSRPQIRPSGARRPSVSWRFYTYIRTHSNTLEGSSMDMTLQVSTGTPFTAFSEA
jgi:hypothetical protein